MMAADKPSSSSTEVASDIPPRITSTLPEQSKVSTTGPDEIVGHWITDDQLEMLKNVNRDSLSEAFWPFIAAAFAALPGAAEALWKAYIEEPSVALSLLHLLQVVIVFGSACVAVAIGLNSDSHAKRGKLSDDQIRSRKSPLVNRMARE